MRIFILYNIKILDGLLILIKVIKNLFKKNIEQ